MGIPFSKYDNLNDKLKKQNAKTDDINFQLSSNIVGFIYNYNQSLGEKSDSVGNFSCGPNTDICLNFLLQMQKMDSEFSEIKLFKGLFDGVLNKKHFNIDGISTNIKLNPSEMLCPVTLSNPFRNIDEFIENIDSDPSKDLKIKYIRNCTQKNNLTKKQQFQLFVKYYNLSLRLEAGFMTTLDQLSLVNNILDQGFKASLSADNCKGLPLDQQTRCHNLISNCWIGSFGNKVNIYKQSATGSNSNKNPYQFNYNPDKPDLVSVDTQIALIDKTNWFYQELVQVYNKKRELYNHSVPNSKIFKIEEAAQRLESPLFEMVNVSQSFEQNYKNVQTGLKQLKKDLEIQLDSLKQVHSCINGFETDIKKCDPAQTYELMRTMPILGSKEIKEIKNKLGFIPSSKLFESKVKKNKKSDYLEYLIDRESCLYNAKYEQQNVSDIVGKSIQDGGLILFTAGLGEVIQLTINGLNKLKSTNAIKNSLNTSKPAEMNRYINESLTVNRMAKLSNSIFGLALPMVDGAGAIFQSCTEALQRKYRDTISGDTQKLSFKKLVCPQKIFTSGFNKDFAKCYRDTAFAALGVTLPIAKNKNSLGLGAAFSLVEVGVATADIETLSASIHQSIQNVQSGKTNISIVDIPDKSKIPIYPSIENPPPKKQKSINNK